MSYIASKRREYERPASAKAFIEYGKVAKRPGNVVEYATLPTLVKLQPAADFGWYVESTSNGSSEAEVICSGQIFMSDDKKRVGVLKRDTPTGGVGELVMDGVFLARIDPTLHETDLNGTQAFYDAATGLLTNADPGNGLQVGVFGEYKRIKPDLPSSGVWYAEVELNPYLDEAAAAAPADAGTTANTAAITADAYISDFSASADGNGLEQNLYIIAASNDPNDPIEDADYVWDIENGQGTAATPTGQSVSHTFGAGVGRTVDCTITTKKGTTLTIQYTVTIAAASAPALWTKL